ASDLAVGGGEQGEAGRVVGGDVGGGGVDDDGAGGDDGDVVQLRLVGVEVHVPFDEVEALRHRVLVGVHGQPVRVVVVFPFCGGCFGSGCAGPEVVDVPRVGDVYHRGLLGVRDCLLGAFDVE